MKTACISNADSTKMLFPVIRVVIAVAMTARIAGAQDPACADLLSASRLAPKDTVQRQMALNCVLRVDSVRRVRALHAVQPELVRLAQLPWMIPEYHDEQRLVNEVGAMGPVAHLYASPYIGGFRRPWQVQEHGSMGFLAAVVYVETATSADPLNSAYSDLHLQEGMNCIWLSNTAGTPDGWKAAVTLAPANAPCRPTTLPSGTLEVKRFTNPAVFSDSDYVAAARFTEDLKGRALIGVRCLDGWCNLMPLGAIPAPPPTAPERERAIEGWFDEQRLAYKSGGVWHAGPRASITPERGVNGYSTADFDSRWIRVATIEFKQKPIDKYLRWGFQTGRQYLWVRRNAGHWESAFTLNRLLNPAVGPSTPLIVERRTPHLDAAVPGTARFRWTILDDGFWVPCGAACCEVDGGT